MYEKVNPGHPDKIADRIAGAIVDLAYTKNQDPKAAVEVLIGHGKCHIINECSEHLELKDIEAIVKRISKNENIEIDYAEYPQDIHLSDNQSHQFRCGDNGIFKGVPLSDEQKELSKIAHTIYSEFPFDGKYILDRSSNRLIICQSNASAEQIRSLEIMKDLPYHLEINPIGEWSGGIDVDSGVTNRKLGSDMADSVTGGGLCGKDFSKADITLNLYAFETAQRTGKEVDIVCAIGDSNVKIRIGNEERTRAFKDIVDEMKIVLKEKYKSFEGLANWGYF